MIVAEYAGNSVFPATLLDVGGLPYPFYYLRLFDPQTNEEHVIQLEVLEMNDRAASCQITEAQKEPLREARYFYEISGEDAETLDPQGEIIEVGYFNFKDTREANEYYR